MDEAAQWFFGRKPSRHFVSGFLLPGFDPSGEDDETSDIRTNTHGLDLALSKLEHTQCTVSGTLAVYIRGLPVWEELTAKRYGMAPIFQPAAELRRKLKSAVRDRLDTWRKNRGQSASYAEYLNAKQEAYSAECRLVGLPAPNVDLEELALQSNAQEAEETPNDNELDEANNTPEDAIYAQSNTNITDHLADAMNPPDVWVRIPVALGLWVIDLATDLKSRSEELSNEIELAIRKCASDWLQS